MRTTHARLSELLGARACLAGAGATLQRGGGAGAAVQRAVELPSQHAGHGRRGNKRRAVRHGMAGSEERTNYPLTLSVEDSGEALGLTAQVVEPISADRVCGYMQQVLEQLAEALGACPQ
nr:hypothetical protein [Neorhizobium galegae]